MVDYIDVSELPIAELVDGTDYVLIVQNGVTKIATSQNLPFIQGVKGDKGDIGTSIVIRGRLDSTSELPAVGANGDAYLIDGDLWVWTTEDANWQNVGSIRGEQGLKGDKGDKGNPFLIIGTGTSLPTTGVDGNAFRLNDDLYVWNSTSSSWVSVGRFKGDKGDKGDTGERGNPLIIFGVLTSVGDLPLDADAGDAWIVVDNLYQFDGANWNNLGVMRGPAGQGLATGGSQNQIYIKTSSTDYASAWVWLYNVPTVRTVADAKLANLNSSLDTIILEGVNTVGDTFGYRMVYKYQASLPSHDGYFQDALGQIWVLQNKNVTLEMFGGGSAIANNSTALAKVIAYNPKTLELVANTVYQFTSLVTSNIALKIVGNGASFSGGEFIFTPSSTTNKSLSSNAVSGATSVVVAGSGGLAIGDEVIITSNAVLSGTTVQISEWNIIKGISGNTIDLATPLEYGYLTSDTAILTKYNLINGIEIEDVKFFGGMKGLTLTGTKNAKLKKVVMNNYATHSILTTFSRNVSIEDVQFISSSVGLIVGQAIENLIMDGVYHDNPSAVSNVFETSLGGNLSRNIKVSNVTGRNVSANVRQSCQSVFLNDFRLVSGSTEPVLNFNGNKTITLNNIFFRGKGSIAVTTTQDIQTTLNVDGLYTDSNNAIQIADSPKGLKSADISNIRGGVNFAGSNNLVRHSNIKIADVILNAGSSVNVKYSDSITIDNVQGSSTANSTITVDGSTGVLITNCKTDSNTANSSAFTITNSNIGFITNNIFKQDKNYKTIVAGGNNTNIIITTDNYVGANNTITTEQMFLSKAGGTMTGPIVLSGDPTTNLHPVTKQYADGKFVKFDVNQSLTLEQKSYGRGNLSVDSLSGFRNKIINGNFDVWKRATSQTTAGYGSDDRWINNHTGTTKTHSLQTFTAGQTDVPGNPLYFSRTVVSSVAGAGNFCLKSQRIENVINFSGKKATITFYAKADAVKNIAVEMIQNFGSGGSGTFITPLGLVSLTTNWKRYDIVVDVPSISGKTSGTNNCLEFGFWFDSGTDFSTRSSNLGQQSGTFDIARVSVVEGDARHEDDPFGAFDVGMEMMRTLRYCQIVYASCRFYAAGGGHIVDVPINFYPMKSAPAYTLLGTESNTNTQGVYFSSVTTTSARFEIVSTNSGDCYGVNYVYFLQAEL